MEQRTQFAKGPINQNPTNLLSKTATTDGTGTGKIAPEELVEGYAFVTVTAGGDANSIITLPDSPIGSRVVLYVGATGYELRTPSPAVVGINGGTSAAAESAIATLITTDCIRTTAINWVCSSLTAAGVKGVTQVAAD